MGKNGKQNFFEASKVWDFEYKERMSVTSSDSLIVSIKNIKKKKLNKTQIISVINQKGGVGKNNNSYKLSSRVGNAR